jgi:hypothetical protein
MRQRTRAVVVGMWLGVIAGGSGHAGATDTTPSPQSNPSASECSVVAPDTASDRVLGVVRTVATTTLDLVRPGRQAEAGLAAPAPAIAAMSQPATLAVVGFALVVLGVVVRRRLLGRPRDGESA